MSPILRAARFLSILGLAFAGVDRPAFALMERILPKDGDASANWQMAGMLSLGGIPNRSAICATIEPRGSDQDDTSAIQSAIESCPDGEVVSLSAGRFAIAEGSLVLIHKGITLRGAGPGATIMTRKGGAKLGSDQPGKEPVAPDHPWAPAIQQQYDGDVVVG